jgi:hypothetical protein
MASAVAEDREAEVFMAALGQAGSVQRRWHRLATITTPFASLDEMKFGPRSYTPEQRLVIDRAVAVRTELSAPRLPRA